MEEESPDQLLYTAKRTGGSNLPPHICWDVLTSSGLPEDRFLPPGMPVW